MITRPSLWSALVVAVPSIRCIHNIETHGSHDVEPTESALSIAEFLCDHPEILGEDEYLLSLATTE